jgi:hypothetical protein
MGIRSSSVYFFKPLSIEAAWRADAKSFYLMGYQLTWSMRANNVSAETHLDLELGRYFSPQYLWRHQ